MGLFQRLTSPQFGSQDYTWAQGLPPKDADHLVGLVAKALNQEGIEANYDGRGAFIVAGGAQWGLNNLAIVCRTNPRDTWAGFALEHIRKMKAAGQVPQGPIDPRILFLSLQPAEGFWWPDLLASYPEVLPGIAVLPAEDFPSHVGKILDPGRIEEFGGMEHTLAIARANLRQRPFDAQAAYVEPDDPTSAVHFFSPVIEHDHFIASKVTMLDEHIPGNPPGSWPDNGVIVAVPHRALLFFHLPVSAGVVKVIHTMARMTADMFRDNPGQISPDLFYIAPDGARERLTQWSPDGLNVNATGRFEEVLLRLGMVQD